MGVMLSSMYRLVQNGNRIVGGLKYNQIAQRVQGWSSKGASVIQFPPSCKTQSGAANNADGYGKYDDYDIGSKNQCYSTPTYFGSSDELRRAVAITHACGRQAYTDIVLHQYDGGNNGTYLYLGADGKTKNGRFPKHPQCWWSGESAGYVPVDPVFDSNGNFPFGNGASYINGIPKDYMASNAILSGDWLLRTTGFDGFRVDDTKGMNAGFIHRFLTTRAMASRFAYGECFVGDPAELNAWVWNSGMNGRSSTLDFTIHWHLQNVCDNNGNASDLLSKNCAYFKVDPFHAITFVDNADTDATDGQQIIANKGLAYWYILTNEGYPQIYYKDYANDPGCYGLGKIIDNLAWIHENLAFGPTINRYGDSRAIVYERPGYPGLLCCGNWDTWNKKTLTVQTNFGPNVRLHDYSGHHADIWTDGQGRATFTIPSNAYSGGISFLCFSRVGYSQSFSLPRHSTTQTFFGAADLDIGQAVAGSTLKVARIWCDSGTSISLNPEEDSDGIAFGILNSDGNQMTISEQLKAEVARRGYYTLTVTGAPSITAKDFTLQATYTATQDLLDSEIADGIHLPLTHEKEYQQ